MNASPVFAVILTVALAIGVLVPSLQTIGVEIDRSATTQQIAVTEPDFLPTESEADIALDPEALRRLSEIAPAAGGDSRAEGKNTIRFNVDPETGRLIQQ